ncbi:MAG: D-lyxose/D-mannose family sugar isomerase [Verrucomicrobiae bacterium]|nr:D-lyxose/D-mannose family sugar isomerase [Verrucomicrobiae bacterium]
MTRKIAEWSEDFQIYGKERARILELFNREILAWDLKMPGNEPLVIDFGLRRYSEMGLIEFWIANEEKEGYCGKFLFVFNNQTCPYHYHHYKHETFFVVKGKVKMNVEGKVVIMKEGESLAMARGTSHSFAGIGPALLLEVSKPCLPNDSIFHEKKIGKEGVI